MLLGRLPGGAGGLAKPLGLLAATWVAWVLGSVVPYGTPVAIAGVAAVVASGAWLWARPSARRTMDALERRLTWAAEAVFLAGFALMLVVRSFAPDVLQTE